MALNSRRVSAKIVAFRNSATNAGGRPERSGNAGDFTAGSSPCELMTAAVGASIFVDEAYAQVFGQHLKQLFGPEGLAHKIVTALRQSALAILLEG